MIKFNHFKNKEIFILSILILILFIIIVFQVKTFLDCTNCDDGAFYKATTIYSLTDYIKLRYFSWSGRISGDIIVFLFVKNQIWLYRLISIISIILTTFSISKICFSKTNLGKNLISLNTLGLIGASILTSSVFWVSGAPYYLIPVSFGLYVMTFYNDQYFHYKNKFTLFRILLTITGILVSVFGNEQIAIIMMVFIILFHIRNGIKKEKLSKITYLLSVLMIICLLITLLSPGDKNRWIAEISIWFPNFNILPLTAHIKLGLYWIFDSIVNKMTLILFLLSLIPILSYKNNYKNKYLKNIYKVFFIQFIIIIVTKISSTITQYNFFDFNFLYNFKLLKDIYYETLSFSFHRLSLQQVVIGLFPFLYWGIFIFNLLILLINKAKDKVFMFLLLMSGIGSLVLMWFSPTIFASGNRVLYVCSIMWIIVFTKLSEELNLFKKEYFILFIFCFSIINLLSIYLNWIIKGFYTIY